MSEYEKKKKRDEKSFNASENQFEIKTMDKQTLDERGSISKAANKEAVVDNVDNAINDINDHIKKVDHIMMAETHENNSTYDYGDKNDLRDIETYKYVNTDDNLLEVSKQKKIMYRDKMKKNNTENNKINFFDDEINHVYADVKQIEYSDARVDEMQNAELIFEDINHDNFKHDRIKKNIYDASRNEQILVDSDTKNEQDMSKYEKNDEICHGENKDDKKISIVKVNNFCEDTNISNIDNANSCYTIENDSDRKIINHDYTNNHGNEIENNNEKSKEDIRNFILLNKENTSEVTKDNMNFYANDIEKNKHKCVKREDVKNCMKNTLHVGENIKTPQVQQKSISIKSSNQNENIDQNIVRNGYKDFQSTKRKITEICMDNIQNIDTLEFGYNLKDKNNKAHKKTINVVKNKKKRDYNDNEMETIYDNKQDISYTSDTFNIDNITIRNQKNESGTDNEKDQNDHSYYNKSEAFDNNNHLISKINGIKENLKLDNSPNNSDKKEVFDSWGLFTHNKKRKLEIHNDQYEKYLCHNTNKLYNKKIELDNSRHKKRYPIDCMINSGIDVSSQDISLYSNKEYFYEFKFPVTKSNRVHLKKYRYGATAIGRMNEKIYNPFEVLNFHDDKKMDIETRDNKETPGIAPKSRSNSLDHDNKNAKKTEIKTKKFIKQQNEEYLKIQKKEIFENTDIPFYDFAYNKGKNNNNKRSNFEGKNIYNALESNDKIYNNSYSINDEQENKIKYINESSCNFDNNKGQVPKYEEMVKIINNNLGRNNVFNFNKVIKGSDATFDDANDNIKILDNKNNNVSNYINEEENKELIVKRKRGRPKKTEIDHEIEEKYSESTSDIETEITSEFEEDSETHVRLRKSSLRYRIKKKKKKLAEMGIELKNKENIIYSLNEDSNNSDSKNNEIKDNNELDIDGNIIKRKVGRPRIHVSGEESYLNNTINNEPKDLNDLENSIKTIGKKTGEIQIICGQNCDVNENDITNKNDTTNKNDNKKVKKEVSNKREKRKKEKAEILENRRKKYALTKGIRKAERERKKQLLEAECKNNTILFRTNKNGMPLEKDVIEILENIDKMDLSKSAKHTLMKEAEFDDLYSTESIEEINVSSDNLEVKENKELKKILIKRLFNNTNLKEVDINEIEKNEELLIKEEVKNLFDKEKKRKKNKKSKICNHKILLSKLYDMVGFVEKNISIGKDTSRYFIKEINRCYNAIFPVKKYKSGGKTGYYAMIDQLYPLYRKLYPEKHKQDIYAEISEVWFNSEPWVKKYFVTTAVE
ncbi:hypothetical protein COBT_000027 [Conglomerata obtusa]